MLTIFEPILVTLIIPFYFLFLTKLQGANRKPQKRVETPKEVVKESHFECKMFGFCKNSLKAILFPMNYELPKMLECLLKKKASGWYSGQDSLQKSES